MNGKRPRHVPVRTCVVCREKADKRALVRVVRTPNGLQIDLGGKLDGRGAYLCEQKSCWERAASGDVLNHALRTTLTDEDRKRLLQAIP